MFFILLFVEIYFVENARYFVGDVCVFKRYFKVFDVIFIDVL